MEFGIEGRGDGNVMVLIIVKRCWSDYIAVVRVVGVSVINGFS